MARRAKAKARKVRSKAKSARTPARKKKQSARKQAPKPAKRKAGKPPGPAEIVMEAAVKAVETVTLKTLDLARAVLPGAPMALFSLLPGETQVSADDPVRKRATPERGAKKSASSSEPAKDQKPRRT